jgi:hypothetical protein
MILLYGGWGTMEEKSFDEKLNGFANTEAEKEEALNVDDSEN